MNGTLQQTKTRRARLSYREELRRHRLPAHFQAQAPAGEPLASSRITQSRRYTLPIRVSISTENSIEPPMVAAARSILTEVGRAAIPLRAGHPGRQENPDRGAWQHACAH
jgi:hypothetical protein